MSDKKLDVVVLGAGIVGVSAAYAARQQGFSVMLVDRREPGSETSYGNAGILSSGSILPLNQPSLWKSLPKYLTNRHHALRWNPAWAIRNVDCQARQAALAGKFAGQDASQKSRVDVAAAEDEADLAALKQLSITDQGSQSSRPCTLDNSLLDRDEQ